MFFIKHANLDNTLKHCCNMLFLWYKSFHIIALVAWFAGLFYLPRLFVYHSESKDYVSKNKFIIMDYKLYFYIMNPAAILTIISGFLLLNSNLKYYSQQNWMHAKLTLVFFLVLYHLYLGRLLIKFKRQKNTHSSIFLRVINEFPTVILIFTTILVVVKPNLF